LDQAVAGVEAEEDKAWECTGMSVDFEGPASSDSIKDHRGRVDPVVV